MPAKMKPYGEVPTGFEIVEADSEEIKRSLWFNVTLDESAESWDSEIRAINRLQEELGAVSDEIRLVRAQIAAFARCAYTFPDSIDVVLGSVTAAKPLRPRFFVGCESDVLSFFNSEAPPDEKEGVPADFMDALHSYVAAMLKWLGRDVGGFGEPDPGTEQRITELLGTPTDFKKALADYLAVTLVSDCSRLSRDEVRKLDRLFTEQAPEGAGTLSTQIETRVPAPAIAGAFGLSAGSLESFSDLSEQAPDGVYFSQHAAARAIKVLRAPSGDVGQLNLSALSDTKASLGITAIPGWWAKEFAETKARLKKPLDQIFEITSRIAFFHNSPCHKKYFRHVAILLSSIGEMRLRGSIKPSGSDARETNAILLDYLSGLNAWLASESSETMLVGRARKRERAVRVFDALGEATPTKRWLAACLWKTLKSGHSWNKCIELDSNPTLAPASWLRRPAA